MSVAAVILKAKASGLTITPKLVYGVRARMNAKKNGGPKVPRVNTRPADRTHYLVIEIERIVEAKVNALLQQRLGALFG
jgi:hypothetical protein